MNKLKIYLNAFFRSFGFQLITVSTFDSLLSKYLPKNPVIFDVGANKGQSIERFKRIFFEPTLHSFEPIKEEYLNLKRKYSHDKNIFLNNYGVGENDISRDFYVSKKTGSSSFIKKNKNSKWLKIRSKQSGFSENEIIAERVDKVNIVTLDNYCRDNKINHIDLLKIDTQGYEDKVLKGCFEMLSSNKVSIIFTEIEMGNVYEKYLNFYDIEKYLIPNNFRLIAMSSNNLSLLRDINFSNNLIYFNKNLIDI